MRKLKLPPIDKPLVISIALLATGGFFIFLSASAGLLARDGGARFSSVIFSQVALGLIPGIIAMYLASKYHYKNWRKLSLILLGAAFILTSLVFVPFIGFEHNGAKRWLTIGSLTFQPSEFLKIAVLIYFSAWLATIKDKVTTFKWGIMPYLVLMLLVGLILVNQPDIDTFLVIGFSCFAMLFIAGVKLRHVALLVLIGTISFGALAFSKPYLKNRVMSYLDPSSDSLGQSYQVQQSLIAIGSGKFLGRGFGQSIQKFNYLPEAVGDSIFAVAGEEFGFLGSVSIIFLFFLFVSRSLFIASRSTDPFAKYLLVGIAIMIISQSLINIGAMLNILPISGIPLAFVSQGGSALLFTLAEAGIMLNISRYYKATV